MKFIADRMLGKLARLLRLIGYDAEYVKNPELNDIERWSSSGAIFLTRGRRFENQKLNGIYIVRENYPIHQLKEVILNFNLKLEDENLFSRCLECNKKLIPAHEEDVQRRVPEFVKRTKKEFFMCPECRRIYWEGSHRAHMQEIIDTVRKRITQEKKGG